MHVAVIIIFREERIQIARKYSWDGGGRIGEFSTKEIRNE